MKRIWIGVGFLAALLAVGLAVMQITDRQLSGIVQTLQQASLEPAFEEAIQLSHNAEAEWEHYSHLMAALSDHADIDDIDELFAQLKVYQLYKEHTHHAAVCAQLSKAILDLTENHRLTWWNLL